MLIIKKEDVMIQQEEMNSMNNGTHGVHNWGCGNMSQYNAQWQESNQVSLNTSQYNVQQQESNRGCWDTSQYNARQQD